MKLNSVGKVFDVATAVIAFKKSHRVSLDKRCSNETCTSCDKLAGPVYHTYYTFRKGFPKTQKLLVQNDIEAAVTSPFLPIIIEQVVENPVWHILQGRGFLYRVQYCTECGEVHKEDAVGSKPSPKDQILIKS